MLITMTKKMLKKKIQGPAYNKETVCMYSIYFRLLTELNKELEYGLINNLFFTKLPIILEFV